MACRAWACEWCAPMRRKQLIALGLAGEPNRFLTLTIRPAPSRTPNSAAAELSRAWKLIKKRAIRQLGIKKLEYLAVFERTKLGWPHLHILIRGDFLPQRWLSQQMADIAGSPVVWIEAVTNQKKAATYVAKYCGKDPHKFGTLKRYWHSKGYNINQDNEGEENPWGGYTWQRREECLSDLRHEAVLAGFLPMWIEGVALWWGEVPFRLRRKCQGEATWRPPPPSPLAVNAVPGCTAGVTLN
jgi:hypothetical protein